METDAKDYLYSLSLIGAVLAATGVSLVVAKGWLALLPFSPERTFIRCLAPASESKW